MDEEKSEPRLGRGWILLALVVLLILAGTAGLFFLNELRELRERNDGLREQVEALMLEAKKTAERATEAERAAQEAARIRSEAEAQATTARVEAEAAREETKSAREETRTAKETAAMAEERARAAEAEADRIRKEAETELKRLEDALGQVAETRRTALGLVMNLGSDYLKFDFDKSAVRPENRELLSRIAGILLTSKEYHLSVNGHTDDVGSDAYNKALSERRAKAVRDYLVEAGIDPSIIDTEGFGKAQPLVPGTSETARAKNRRVELGIVSTRIEYLRGKANKD